MPDDEHFEYLATDGAISLDEIIFPSVQAAGAVLNVVLFQKAARGGKGGRSGGRGDLGKQQSFGRGRLGD